MAVIESSRCLRGVSAHEQLIVHAGQGTQNSFHDRLWNTGCLIDDEHHVIFVEALHILRFRGSSSGGEPALFVADHVDIGFCPFQDLGENW